MPETSVRLAAAINSTRLTTMFGEVVRATLWVDDAGRPLLDVFVWDDAEGAPPEDEDHDCGEEFCHQPAASFMVGVREAKDLMAMLAAVVTCPPTTTA